MATSAPADTDLALLLSQASHALATELTAGLTELAISPRAHCVLSKAMGNELTQSQLAGLCAQTTMVVTIDELERAGLAERRLSGTDRRARIIFVTEAGERMGRARPRDRGADLRRRPRHAARRGAGRVRGRARAARERTPREASRLRAAAAGGRGREVRLR